MPGELICSGCNKVLNNVAVDKGWAVVYGKCKGKKCPDCGKIRKLGSIKITLFNAGASDVCPKCEKHGVTAEFSSSSTQGVCSDCFWEDEKEKGCICVYSRLKWGKYYCPLCRDIHKWFNFKCKDCAVKKEVEVKFGKKLLRPWQVIVPSFLIGAVVSGVAVAFYFWKKTKSNSFLKSTTKKKFTP